MARYLAMHTQLVKQDLFFFYYFHRPTQCIKHSKTREVPATLRKLYQVSTSCSLLQLNVRSTGTKSQNKKFGTAGESFLDCLSVLYILV